MEYAANLTKLTCVDLNNLGYLINSLEFLKKKAKIAEKQTKNSSFSFALIFGDKLAIGTVKLSGKICIKLYTSGKTIPFKSDIPFNTFIASDHSSALKKIQAIFIKLNVII